MRSGLPCMRRSRSLSRLPFGTTLAENISGGLALARRLDPGAASARASLRSIHGNEDANIFEHSRSSYRIRHDRDDAPGERIGQDRLWSLGARHRGIDVHSVWGGQICGHPRRDVVVAMSVGRAVPAFAGTQGRPRHCRYEPRGDHGPAAKSPNSFAAPSRITVKPRFCRSVAQLTRSQPHFLLTCIVSLLSVPAMPAQVGRKPCRMLGTMS
jgi:hypothetical protein